MVLATGGGAFINEETRALILQRQPLHLARRRHSDAGRTRRAPQPPPAAQEPRCGEVLRELAAVRNPIYAEAHLRVSSASTPHDHTVRAILEALATWKS
jgi:shikimate kinase